MMYDINLIPQTKKNASGRINSTMIFIGLFCFVVLAVFFFYFPLQQKLSLNKQIQAKEEEITIYANVRGEYDTLSAQSDQLKQIALNLEHLREDKLKLTELINHVEESMPKSITANRIQLEEGLLTIEGSSSAYKDIAQFMVKMRQLEGVLSVAFMGATANEDLEEGDSNANDYKQDLPQSFTMSIRYDIDGTDVEADTSTVGGSAE